MTRRLHWFNLLGVLALGTLCVLQWRAHRQLNLELNRLEQQRHEQAAQLEETTKTAAGQTSDLAGLRSHLARLTDELKRTAEQLATAEREWRVAAAQCDQLKSSVTNWAAAVAARDERLEQAAGQLKVLTTARDDVLKQFNELAARHNKLVKEWNELQARLAEHAKGSPQAKP